MGEQRRRASLKTASARSAERRPYDDGLQRRIDARLASHGLGTGYTWDGEAFINDGGVALPASAIIMSPIAAHDLWASQKHSLRRGFKGKQSELDPFYDRDELEEAARRFAERLAEAAAAEMRAAYATRRAEIERAYAPRRAEVNKAYMPRRAEVNKAYAPRRAEIDRARAPEDRPSGMAFYRQPRGGMIVAVDGEDANFGLPFTLDKNGNKHFIDIAPELLPEWWRCKQILDRVQGTARKKGATVYRDQRCVLWMGGGVEDIKDETGAIRFPNAIEKRPQGFTSYESMESLTSLPRRFASNDKGAKRPSFVGFSFNYDVAQILKDLPEHKLYALQKGKAWKHRDNSRVRGRRGVWELCGPFAAALIPGKWIKIGKLKDRDHPWKMKNGKATRAPDILDDQKIIIEDAFGFFGKSLVKAINDMQSGSIVTNDELEIIIAGKAERGALESDALTVAKFDELIRYTGLELKATAQLVEATRMAIHDADVGSRRACGEENPEGIWLTRLHGAGAAAQALLDSRLPKDPRPLLGNLQSALDELAGLAGLLPYELTAHAIRSGDDRLDITDGDDDDDGDNGDDDGRVAIVGAPEEKREILHEMARRPVDPAHISVYALLWATHAFFGGRIELLKHGNTTKRLFEPDVSSAYPATIAELPSMEGGRWRRVINPTFEEIRRSNILSMFRVRTRGFSEKHPLFPFPFRCDGGAVVYPPDVDGLYMRDEVLAGFEWLQAFAPMRTIEVTEALIFEHADPTFKPFAWVKDLFDYRAELIKANRNDVRAIVIKLMLNSIYGKFAQGIGSFGRLPKYACPWYAAAITAATRRKLMSAALTNPKSVVAFTTDAMVTDAPIEFDTSPPGVKELGQWGFPETYENGGVFVMPGMNCTPGNGLERAKMKSRGVSPALAIGVAETAELTFEKIMLEIVPACWAAGESEYKYAVQTYNRLGAAVESRFPKRVIGTWSVSERTIELDNRTQRKRGPPSYKRDRLARAVKLVPLPVRTMSGAWMPGDFSAAHSPKWLDEAIETNQEIDDEEQDDE
jgi:DNA polymerase type B, organellar and viral